MYKYGLLFYFVKDRHEPFPDTFDKLKQIINQKISSKTQQIISIMKNYGFKTEDDLKNLCDLMNKLYKIVVHPLYPHNFDVYEKVKLASHYVLQETNHDIYSIEKMWIEKLNETKYYTPNVSAYTDLSLCSMLKLINTNGYGWFFDEVKKNSSNSSIVDCQSLILDLINHDRIKLDNVYDRKWLMSMIMTVFLHGSLLIPTFDPTSNIPIQFQNPLYNEFFESIIEKHKYYQRIDKYDSRVINSLKCINRKDLKDYPGFIHKALTRYLLRNNWVNAGERYELNIMNELNNHYYSQTPLFKNEKEIYELLVKTKISLVLEGILDPRYDSLLFTELSDVYMYSTSHNCRFEFLNPAIRDTINEVHEKVVGKVCDKTNEKTNDNKTKIHIREISI